MGKKPLEDFIAKLSPEERLRHKALIDECLERDRTINENTEKTLKAVEDFKASLSELRQGMTRLEKCTERHRDATFNLLSDLVPLLESLPGNKPSLN
ncbi:MAG TPA: hypothetical protein VK435_10250 [Thermodesulfovibrionales bacterium]|nr:hypothetical protein [Thermodesulfovibrionales bacterium]